MKIGWSRSREFEKIVKLFEKEDGYRYIEYGEEVAHAIPVQDIDAVKRVIIKYEKAIKWKETTFEIPSGDSFYPLKPIPLCFMRLMVEDNSPCKEGKECPHSQIPLMALMNGKFSLEEYFSSEYEEPETPELIEDLSEETGLVNSPDDSNANIANKTSMDVNGDSEDESQNENVEESVEDGVEENVEDEVEDEVEDARATEHSSTDEPLLPEEIISLISEKYNTLSDTGLIKLFITELLENKTLLFCPFYRTLVSLAAEKLFPGIGPLWSFLYSDVKESLTNGHLIIDSDGNYLPMGDPTDNVVYDTTTPTYISSRARWAAVNGSLELVSDGSSIYKMPEKEVVAPWPALSSILETTRGRYLLFPPDGFNEDEFMVMEENGESFPVGPFKAPWAMDSKLEKFIFAEHLQSGMSIVKRGDCFWNSSLPTLLVDEIFEVQGRITRLITSSKSVALSTEKNMVLYRLGENEKEELFTGLVSMHFLGEDELVLLWGSGSRITFINDEKGRRDYFLLIKGDELHSTTSGNVIIVFPSHILEVSPDGEILDYKWGPDSIYFTTAQGYLEKKNKEVTWHFLDRTVISDDFPEEKPDDILVVSLPKMDDDVPRSEKELLIELLIYLNSFYEEEEYRDQVRRLWKQAPRKVKKELSAMENRFEWFKNFRKNKTKPWLVESGFLGETQS
jgi:hypothetical protein